MSTFAGGFSTRDTGSHSRPARWSGTTVEAPPGAIFASKPATAKPRGYFTLNTPTSSRGGAAASGAGLFMTPGRRSSISRAPIIYRGTFGTGMFQCLYQPAPCHWALIPSTLEWHGIAALLAVAALVVWPPLGWLTVAMITLAVAVAALRALESRLPAEHRHWRARVLIALLCYLQPLVRSWVRYQVRLIWHELPKPDLAMSARPHSRGPWIVTRSSAYWSETGRDRIELLKKSIDYMNEYRIGKVIDSGWFDWDIGVYCQAGIVLKVATAGRPRWRQASGSRPLQALGRALACLVGIG